MAAWLDSIMSPLNAAGEGLQKLIETRDLVKFGDTFRKLHGEVLAAMQGAIAAQTREATLLDRVSQLEKEMARFEAWDAEKQRYELKDFGAGAFAYSLKANARGGEPAHQICPTCYENRRKSILQIVPGNNARTALGIRAVHRCPVCKTEVAL
jgi:hypothetical protein